MATLFLFFFFSALFMSARQMCVAALLSSRALVLRCLFLVLFFFFLFCMCGEQKKPLCARARCGFFFGWGERVFVRAQTGGGCLPPTS